MKIIADIILSNVVLAVPASTLALSVKMVQSGSLYSGVILGVLSCFWIVNCSINCRNDFMKSAKSK